MVLHPDYTPQKHTPISLTDGDDRSYIDTRTGVIVQMAQIPTQSLKDELKRREGYTPSLPSQFPPRKPVDWNSVCRFIGVWVTLLGAVVFGGTMLIVSFALNLFFGLMALGLLLLLTGTITYNLRDLK